MNPFKKHATKPTKLYHHIQRIKGEDRILKSGDEVLFDCGTHYVGYVTLDILPCGHHQDAPLFLQINFYEHPSEMHMQESDYAGWISHSWIQEEKIHVDVLPKIVKLERRYAFRFISVKILSTSDNFQIQIQEITLDTVSAVSEKSYDLLAKNETNPINLVALRTLQQCMQNVFEDGPKRDRRLWLGDLRLQALANEVSFQKYELVKKCLYQFASCQNPDGTLPSNVFQEPQLEGDFQVLVDYSLLYIPTLKEYYENTKDLKTLKALFPVADRQHEIYSKMVQDFTLQVPRSFIDWNLNLDKSCSIYGVYLYALEALTQLYTSLQKNTDALSFEFKELQKSIKARFYDSSTHLFVSGEQHQLSYASQIWMILGGVIEGKEAIKLLQEFAQRENVEEIVSPYLYHYYIEALIKLGLMDEARDQIDSYWGAMIQDGADTFYEIFNPKNPAASPYGGKIVHSFCHAWSCTPYYFDKKYLAHS